MRRLDLTAALPLALVATLEVAGRAGHELLRGGVIGKGDPGCKALGRPTAEERDGRLVVTDDDDAIGAGEPAERPVGKGIGRRHAKNDSARWHNRER